MSNISSIDDLLMGKGNSQQPETPEAKNTNQEIKEPTDDVNEGNDDYGVDDNISDDVGDESDSVDNDKDEQDADDSSDSDGDVNDKTADDDVDEYGNKKERMSKGMKERLDRKEKQHQREIEQRDRELENLRYQLAQKGASKQVQDAASDFKYDENSDVSWQEQLTAFVKQTIQNVGREEQESQRAAREQQNEREFKQKFTQGMDRFADFREVVGAQPIDDAMTMALRGMKDPSAFIYAASKRQPQELERISKIQDPYARVVEMGKLEERMRRNKPTTKTPRPLGRTKEDTTVRIKQADKKETTGDDLLAKADAKRLTTVKNRHARNR